MSRRKKPKCRHGWTRGHPGIKVCVDCGIALPKNFKYKTKKQELTDLERELWEDWKN